MLEGWKTRCAEYFPYSTYFGGIQSSVVSKAYLSNLTDNSENVASNHPELTNSITLNGRLETFKDLKI